MLGQVGFKLVKQGFDDLRLRQGFTKQPDGLGIGNALIQIEPQEPHEGQSIADLIFGLVIGQIIEALEDEDFEHQHGIKRGTASLRPLRPMEHGFNGRAKGFPGHMTRQRV